MDHDDLDGFEDLTPVDDRIGPAPADRIGPAPLERTRRSATRLGVSVPGAVGGALLVCAIAFGANLGLAGSSEDADEPITKPTPSSEVVGLGMDDEPGKTETAEPTKAPDGPGDDETGDVDPTEKPEPTEEPTDKPDAEPTEKPDAEPTKKPEPEPTKKPEPKPTDKPDAEPTEKPVLDLALAIKEGAILIKWSVCDVDGADYYKVVRSSDSTVRWPAGDNDDVIAGVEVGGEPKAWDEGAPAGKKAWYRVFCVRQTEDGSKVVAASETGSIVAPDKEPEPTPKPTPETDSMWIEAGVDGGAVVLHWEACGSDAFSHYRIVRKVDGDGAVIAEIENQGTTTFVDTAVEPGVTYHYVVQAKGQIEGDWVLLGTTEWVAVTVE